MGEIWILLKESRLARQIAAGLAVAALAGLLWLAFSRHYVSIGKQKGEQQSNQAADVATEQTHAADRGATAQQLASLQAIADAAQKRADAAAERAARLEGQVTVLAQQRQAAQDAVSRIPDGGLHDYNVARLAIRPASDPAPGYTPAEERKIAELVTTAPLVQDQLAQSAAAIAEVKQQVTELKGKVDAQDQRYTSLAGYTSRLEGYYAQVWNRTPKKKRSPKCLMLWHCGTITLAVPDPAQLARPQ